MLNGSKSRALKQRNARPFPHLQQSKAVAERLVSFYQIDDPRLQRAIQKNARKPVRCKQKPPRSPRYSHERRTE
jgi:hypothetical protein